MTESLLPHESIYAFTSFSHYNRFFQFFRNPLQSGFSVQSTWCFASAGDGLPANKEPVIYLIATRSVCAINTRH
jgi:hypothetical protein